MDGTDKRLGLVPLRVRYYLAKYSRMFGPSRSTYHPVKILLSIELSPSMRRCRSLSYSHKVMGAATPPFRTSMISNASMAFCVATGVAIMSTTLSGVRCLKTSVPT